MPFYGTDLKSAAMTCVSPFCGQAASYLPAGKKWKLFWNDEFDGTALDESK